MTKKYKIDFNNGKVFEVQSSDGTKFFLNSVALHSAELISMGATITEIEEPRRELYVSFATEVHMDEWSAKEFEGSIKMTQLNKGEVIVSREKLAEAWVTREDMSRVGAPTFEQLCKELGLGE
jgi:hypothetical protein